MRVLIQDLGTTESGVFWRAAETRPLAYELFREPTCAQESAEADLLYSRRAVGRTDFSGVDRGWDARVEERHGTGSGRTGGGLFTDRGQRGTTRGNGK